MDCESSPHDSQRLKNIKVCVTGRLACMTQQHLASLVTAYGGRFLRQPIRGSFILVLGEDGWPAEHDGSPTRIFRRARELQAMGYPVEFMPEHEFYERWGLVERSPIHARYTIADLARVLDLPAARLQRWLKLGLITPVETVHRLSYFDFRQVTSAKRLCELLGEGAKLRDIRAGLEHLRDWMPECTPFEQLDLLEHDGRILLRLEQGLTEPNGQRLFDFDSAEEGEEGVSLVAFQASSDSVDDLFDEALAFEDAGHLEEALSVYERAIALDPHDAVLQFNRGNVLYGLGRLDDAVQAYRGALARDPHYAEAWNNLGNVLAEADRLPEAAQALKKAVAFVPDYADAHFNLANVLARMGESTAASRHRTLYQRLQAAR